MSWGSALLARWQPRAPIALQSERDGALDRLMERLAEGDDEAFAELAASVLARLTPFFARMGAPATACEALAREIVRSLEERRGSFPRAGSAVHFAYALAVRRHAAHEAARSASEQGVERVAEWGRARAAAVSLRALEPRRRAAFVLVRYEQLSFAGAAEVLGVSERRARIWVAEALGRIESELAAPLLPRFVPAAESANAGSR